MNRDDQVGVLITLFSTKKGRERVFNQEDSNFILVRLQDENELEDIEELEYLLSSADEENNWSIFSVNDKVPYSTMLSYTVRAINKICEDVLLGNVTPSNFIERLSHLRYPPRKLMVLDHNGEGYITYPYEGSPCILIPQTKNLIGNVFLKEVHHGE